MGSEPSYWVAPAFLALTLGCAEPRFGTPTDASRPPAEDGRVAPDTADDRGTVEGRDTDWTLDGDRDPARDETATLDDAVAADPHPSGDLGEPFDGFLPDDIPLPDDSLSTDIGDARDVDAPGTPDAPTADNGPIPFPPCPTFAAGQRTGWVLHAAVTEASGVVASRKNADVLWVHNDSGGKPEIYGVATNGAHRGNYSLDGANAKDWEDIAIGPGPKGGIQYIYVADIGDNGASRNDYRLYRVPEPVADGGLVGAVTLTGVEEIEIDYPDGSHNAEAMFVDPWTADVYIVTKRGNGNSPVYRAIAPLKTSGSNVMEYVTTLQFGSASLPGGTEATAADMAPAGDAFAIRTYSSAFLWRRTPGMTVADALATEPCPIPVTDQGMGEALGFSADGVGYFTVPEGRMVGIYFFSRQ